MGGFWLWHKTAILGVCVRLVEPNPTQKVLTPAELRVLCKVADGYRHKQIGDLLCIETTTITAHLRHIWDKLGSSNAPSMVALALKRGVIRLLAIALLAIQATPTAVPGSELMRPVRGGRSVSVSRPVVRLRQEVS